MCRRTAPGLGPVRIRSPHPGIDVARVPHAEWDSLCGPVPALALALRHPGLVGLMDDEERMMLLERIKRLRKSLTS
jgi:hypothetical protein